MITVLEWDSDFFELRIGKVELDHFSFTELERLMIEKEKNNFDLVYLFLNEADDSVISCIEKNGGRFVDQKVTYQKKITTITSTNSIVVKKYEGVVSSKLLQLALESGHKSRFKEDPVLNSHFHKFYHLWIEKSVKREIADEVLVSIHNNEISGFVTMKTNASNGSIGLIAVDKNYRGMGIGKELLVAAENWFISKHCIEAVIITQKENPAACGLYESMGYKISSSQFVFHL